MQKKIAEYLNLALAQIIKEGRLPVSEVSVTIEETRNKEHGDFSSNIALILAKEMKQKPRNGYCQINC